MKTEYAYASGKIRALENKFFNKPELAGLLEMPFSSIVEELENRGYPGVEKEKNIIGKEEEIIILEEMIDTRLSKAYKMVRELSLDPAITDAFILLNDGHNLKGLIKLKYTQIKKKKKVFLKKSLFGEEELKKMVESNNFSAFPLSLQGLPHEAVEAYKRWKNPQNIDFILDRGFWEYFKTQTEENVFVNEVRKIRIDLINILIFLRLKEKKQKETILTKSLISGGTITKDKFLENFSDQKNINDFIGKIKFSPYKEIVREGYNYWEKERSFSFLEKLGDDFLINYIKKAKYSFLSINLLIGYLLARENEAKNLRILLYGKYSDLSKEIIEGELRETYV